MVVAIHRTRNSMTLLCKHGKYAKIFGFLFAGPLEAMQLECKQYMMDLMCIYYKVSHHIIYRQSYFWCHWLGFGWCRFRRNFEMHIWTIFIVGAWGFWKFGKSYVLEVEGFVCVRFRYTICKSRMILFNSSAFVQFFIGVYQYFVCLTTTRSSNELTRSRQMTPNFVRNLYLLLLIRLALALHIINYITPLYKIKLQNALTDLSWILDSFY